MSKATSRHSHNSNKILISYIVGFVLSIILTLAAYWLVVNHVFSRWDTVLIIASLAITQLIVQLLCFLHIGSDSRPRWKLITFFSMLVILLIVVIGSLWIMQNLNYRMMHSPSEMKAYIESQQGL